MSKYLEENPEAFQEKLFDVWKKTQVRLRANVLAFWESGF